MFKTLLLLLFSVHLANAASNPNCGQIPPGSSQDKDCLLMPTCPPTMLRGTAEVLADVVDVQCVGKSGDYVAHLKITKVLSGKINEKFLALNFSRGADRPASGVAMLAGDKERLKLHLCDKNWMVLSSDDRTALLASAGMLPVCK